MEGFFLGGDIFIVFFLPCLIFFLFFLSFYYSVSVIGHFLLLYYVLTWKVAHLSNLQVELN